MADEEQLPTAAPVVNMDDTHGMVLASGDDDSDGDVLGDDFEMAQDSGGDPEDSDDDDDHEEDEDDLAGLKSAQRKEKKPRRKLNDAITAILDTRVRGSTTATATRPAKVILSRTAVERQLDDAKVEDLARKVISSERKVQRDKDRIKPSALTLDYEKKLRKVATRGVVKLFNAVREAQQASREEVSKSSATVTPVHVKEKAAAVSKTAFLDLLRKRPAALVKRDSEGTTDAPAATTTTTAGSATTGKKWNVLSKDFMMGAKLKDWGEGEIEEEREDEHDVDMDFA
ncbi:pre-60S ribosomal particles component [Sorochytrium milnesiophthora]